MPKGKTMKAIPILVLCLFATPAIAHHRGIVAVGDSITAPLLELGAGFGWVEHLRNNMGVPVNELAVSGASSGLLAAQDIPKMFYSGKFQRNPVTIISIGTIDGTNGVSPLRFGLNLARLAKNLGKAGANDYIFLITPTDTGDPAGHELRRDYAELMLSVCVVSAKARCLDLRRMPFSLFRDGDGSDVHPTAEGHVWIASWLRAFLSNEGF